MTDPHKYVYSFGGGTADGKADMKDLLGGKGANLAEMCKIGIPVPPGFTITTEVCAAYYEQRQEDPRGGHPADRRGRQEGRRPTFGKKFGDPADPLLVSVRSGAALSMPGMMNTILNLGLTDASVEGLAKKTGNPRFAYDSYRRLIDMFGSTAMGVEHEHFEHEIHELKDEKRVKLDTDLTPTTSRNWSSATRPSTRSTSSDDFPQDPNEAALMLAINAVFNSLERQQGDRVPPHRADHRPEGHGRQRPGDGLRQHGRQLRHRRRLHPRPEHRRERLLRRLPDQRPGRGRRRRHPHPGADRQARRARCRRSTSSSWTSARRWRSTTRRCRTSSSPCRTARCTCSRPGPASGPAPPPCGSPSRWSKEKLIDETTAVKRVNPGQPQPPAPAAARPEGEGQAGRPGHRGQPRRRVGQGRPLGRGGRRARREAPERPDHARPQGDQPRGRRRHAPGQGHPHQHRRQGEPRGRRRPRLGQAVRRRLRGDQDRRDEADRSRSPARRSRPATSSRSTARPAT